MTTLRVLAAALSLAAAAALSAPAVAAPEAAPGAAPAAAQADDHAGHGHAPGEHGHEKVGAMPTAKQGIATAATALVVFSITAAFLGLVVWPKITKGLQDREDKIRNSIEEAELAQEQAKAALAQYERNLAQARAEAQKMLDDAKAQQQAIAADLKVKAEAELALMREKARRDIDLAKRAAVSEIQEYATDLATRIAGKILQRDINPTDQQRLVTESLAELQSAGRN